MQPIVQPNAGASQYPPSFSNYYSPNMGQQNIATNAVGAIGGMASAVPSVMMGAGTVAGVAGMFGYGGAAGAALSAMDPFTAGLNSMSAGANAYRSVANGQRAMSMAARFGRLGTMARVGSGVASGMGAGALAMAPTALALGAGYVGSQMGQGMQHQAEINRMFSDFSFANPTALGGRGFNASQMGRIGSAIHNIDKSSGYINGGDSMQIAQQFRQSGLDRGVTNVVELTSKLKEFGELADKVARRMGTAITEVSGLIQQFRGVGYMSSKDVLDNTTNMRLAESMGVSNSQFMSAQQAGAQMSMGMGLTNRAGAQMASNVSMQMLDTFDAGVVDTERMMQLTGTQNRQDAAMAFGQKMQGRFGNFFRSKNGQAMLAALGKTDKSGRFTGEVDSGTLSSMGSGGSLDNLLDVGGSKTRSRAGGRTFMANQDQILNNLMESPEALNALVGSMSSMASKAGLGDHEDGFVLIGKQLQMGTEMELRELYKFAGDQKRRRISLLKKKAQEIATEDFQTRMARQGTISGLWQGVKGDIHDATIGRLQGAGMEFAADVGAEVERMGVRFVGMLGGPRADTYSISDSQFASTVRDINSGKAGGVEDLRDASSVSGNRTGLLANIDNGITAQNIQRAAIARNYSSITRSLSNTIDSGRKKMLDDKKKQISRDDRFTKMMGEARALRQAGDREGMKKVLSRAKRYLKANYGVGAGAGASSSEFQYILQEAGMEDVVASDIASTELEITEGTNREDSLIRTMEESVYSGTYRTGADALDMTQTDYMDSLGTATQVGMGIGAGLTGAWAGMKIGAAIGSAGTPLGSMIGAFAGMIIGGVGGVMFAQTAQEDSKEFQAMRDLIDSGTASELLGKLREPSSLRKFAKIMDAYQKAAKDGEDIDYEAAAKRVSKAFNITASAQDVKNAEALVLASTPKGTSMLALSKMSDEQIRKSPKLRKLTQAAEGFSRLKATQAIMDRALETVSGETSGTGLESEDALMDALEMDPGQERIGQVGSAIQQLIEEASASGLTASEDDSTLKRALASTVTFGKDVDDYLKGEGAKSIQGLSRATGIKAEDLMNRLGKSSAQSLVSKEEIAKFATEYKQDMVLGTIGATSGGRIVGTDGLGDDTTLQANAMKQTAHMIDALFAHAKGGDAVPVTDGGKEVFNNLKAEGPE